MKDKKGFTLVELLAVIAILAILVIIALPNVINMYTKAKKQAFITEAQNVIKSASNKFIEGSMQGKNIITISSDDDTLNLTNKNVKYYIELDNTGKVKNYTVSNSNYCLSSSKSYEKLTSDDVVNEDCGEFVTYEFYVSSEGNDENTGTNKNVPLASIEKAYQLIGKNNGIIYLLSDIKLQNMKFDNGKRIQIVGVGETRTITNERSREVSEDEGYRPGASINIYNKTKVEIKNVILDANKIRGISINESTLTMNDSEVKNGYSYQASSVCISGYNSNITLNNTNIHDCSSAAYSAISQSGGNLILNNSNIYNNTGSINWGGAIGITRGAKAFVEGGNIKNNTHTSSAGAIYVDETSELAVNNVQFDSNTASGGSSSGGAIYSKGDLTVKNSTFQNNRAGMGGAIEFLKEFSIQNSKFYNNSSNHGGGAIYGGSDSKNDVNIENCYFEGNTTTVNGGAIIILARKTYIKKSDFIGNKGKWGGAIDVSEGSIIDECNVKNNSATSGGGAIRAGNIIIKNSTITGNKSSNKWSSISGSNVTFENTTIDGTCTNPSTTWLEVNCTTLIK